MDFLVRQIKAWGTILCLGALTIACVPTDVIPKLRAAEAVVEQQVDATLEYTVDRLCQLPVDTMARASADSDMAKAIYYACPEVREFTLNMLRSVGEDRFNVNIDVGIPE